MLQELKLRNFKTWEVADVEFGKITGLFGPNSSGKTTLIQFLLLLKQTKQATDRATSLDLNGALTSLGVYRDMIHAHDEKRSLSWTLAFTPAKDVVLVDPSGKRTDALARASSITVSSDVLAKGQAAAAVRLEYNVGKYRFGLAPKGTDHSAFELTARGGDFRFVRTQGRPWQLAGPVKSYAFPDQARTYFQNASFLSDLEASYEEQMDSLFYLGPLRVYPERDYLWARSRPVDVGLRGEKAIDAILAATAAGE